MTPHRDDAAAQRLYDAASQWQANPDGGPAAVIDAACQALVDGLDSPALRELAGAAPTDRHGEVSPLVDLTLDELGLPPPGSVRSGYQICRTCGVVRRVDVDRLRLVVAPAQAPVGGAFQVLVQVNDVEITSAGAGLGMDPADILEPVNRLVAVAKPAVVPIARCTCGVHGCGGTDVTIVRDGDRVHWDWSGEVPMARGVSFDAAAYDAEVARVAADHSWETPERTAGRLIRAGVDHAQLARYGLTLGWVAPSHDTADALRVALHLGDDYQVFVDTPWGGRNAEQLAAEVQATLAQNPRRWSAQWRAVARSAAGRPPRIAGRRWREERFS
jgi:hypothetical protein